MFNDVFKQIGLNKLETAIYLNSLRLWTQKFSVIYKRISDKFFFESEKNVLHALNNLIKLWFIDIFSWEEAYYIPIRPSKVKIIMENNLFRFENWKKKLEELNSRIEKYLDPSFSKPETLLFEGEEWIMSVYEDTLTSKTDILAITSLQETESFDARYIDNYYKRRSSAWILIKAIFTNSELALKRQKMDYVELRVSKIVPKEILDFEIELNIYDDKVAYFAIKEKLAILIKSTLIANSMRGMFEMCWQPLERFPKQN